MAWGSRCGGWASATRGSIGGGRRTRPTNARGDARRAGGIAVYLAGEHRIDGQSAAAAGWISRARRLLEGEGTVPEAGWLAIEEAKRADEATGRRAACSCRIGHRP